MRRFYLLLAASAALAVGCSDAPIDNPVVAESESEIVNGQLDTTRQAVVAVLSSQSACTGTIIDVQPPYAVILTAAHCVDDAPQVVIQGNDYNSGSAIQYNVVEYLAHPGYNGSVNDFAMVRVTGASASTPTMAVLTPAQDNVANGQVLTHSGYGTTNPNGSGNNTQRRFTTGQVVDTSNLTITFNAMSSGVCFGDSGGPNITSSNAVAGVNSSVSTGNCNGYSFSGRASAVWNSFILPFINGTPPPPVDCDGCFEASTTGNGSCTGAVNACFNNATCSALVQCINGCTTQTCVNNCAQMHSGGVDLYNAIFECVCDVGCATECMDAPMCQGGGGAPPNGSAVANSAVAADASSSAASGMGGATNGAGGAGGAGIGGAMASNGAGNGYYAGDTPDGSPDGFVLSSGCAYGQRGGSSWSWLALAGLAFAFVTRRRRRA